MWCFGCVVAFWVKSSGGKWLVEREEERERERFSLWPILFLSSAFSLGFSTIQRFYQFTSLEIRFTGNLRNAQTRITTTSLLLLEISFEIDGIGICSHLLRILQQIVFRFFFFFWKIAMEFKSIGNDTFLEFEIWWSGPLKIGTTNLIGWDGRYQSQMNLSDGITILIQCISNLVHTKNGHFLNFPLEVLPTHFIWNALPFISKSKAWFCRRQFTSCLLNVDLETGRSSGTEAFQHELQQQPTI